MLYTKYLISFSLLFFFASLHAQTKAQKNYFLVPEKITFSEQQSIQKFWQSTQTTHKGTFMGVDDIAISYRYFIHPNESNAIILVNGRTESYLKYQQLAYELYKNSYSVYLYDHRGQGFSQRMLHDTEKGYVKKFDHYVHDLNTFHKLIVSPNHHQKLFIIAHSMGGAIALQYAMKYPQNVQAMALSAPMLGLNHQWLMCPIAKSLSWIEQVFDLTPDYAPSQSAYNKPEFQAHNPSMMTHSRARYQRNVNYNTQYPHIKLGGITTHWLAQACRAVGEIQENVIQLSVPLVLFQAGEDGVVSAKAQDNFCAELTDVTPLKCGTKESNPIIIHGAFHELFMEKDDYRIPVINTILDFFTLSADSLNQ